MNKSYITSKGFLCVLLIYFFPFHLLFAQQTVTIGSEDLNPNAILKLDGNGSQGLLLPIANTDAFTPDASEAGMLVYNNNDNLVYYWNGTSWISVNTSSGGGSSFGLMLDNNTGELMIVENGGVSNVSLSNLPIGGDLSGTLSNATIGDGAITLNKIANNGNTRALLATGGAGNVAWLSPNNDNQVLGTDGTGD